MATVSTDTSLCPTNGNGTKGRQNFLQISQLFLDVGTAVLRRLLQSYIKDRLKTTLNSFLLTQKTTLQRQSQKGFLQMNTIYPGGTPCQDLEAWDISLLSCVLKNCCCLTSSEITDIDEIREKRNSVFAHRVEASLSIKGFQTTWTNIVSVINNLLKSINDPAFSVEVDERIKAIRNNKAEVGEDILLSIQHQLNRLESVDRADQEHNKGMEVLV